MQKNVKRQWYDSCTTAFIAATLEGDSPAGGLTLQHVSVLCLVCALSLMCFPSGLKGRRGSTLGLEVTGCCAPHANLCPCWQIPVQTEWQWRFASQHSAEGNCFDAANSNGRRSSGGQRAQYYMSFLFLPRPINLWKAWKWMAGMGSPRHTIGTEERGNLISLKMLILWNTN